MSEGEGDSTREPEDADSCDEIRRHGNMLAEHGDVLTKLKMQVRDIKVRVSISFPSLYLYFYALPQRSVQFDKYETLLHLRFSYKMAFKCGFSNFVWI